MNFKMPFFKQMYWDQSQTVKERCVELKDWGVDNLLKIAVLIHLKCSLLYKETFSQGLSFFLNYVLFFSVQGKQTLETRVKDENKTVEYPLTTNPWRSAEKLLFVALRKGAALLLGRKTIETSIRASDGWVRLASFSTRRW